MIYMTSFSLNSMSIHLAKKDQIASLIAEEVKIITDYLNFLDIFLEKKDLMLPEIIELN